MKSRFIMSIAVVLFAFISFSFIEVNKAKDNKTTMETISVPQDKPADFEAGKKIYEEKCIVCHMATGLGVTGAFPPLAKSDYLMADKVRAVAQVLNGSNEKMVVNGVTYSIPMPPQVDTKKDAVAVINYVLNSFGNEGGSVSMEEVKGIEIKPRP
jgi:mono/diheme cytochrome c family protein